MAAVSDTIEDSVYLDLLALLRQRTQDAHDRLDAALASRAPGTLTRSRYAALLRATFSVVVPLEPVLAEWLPFLPAPARASCLLADFAALGQAPPHASAPSRSPRTLAEAYGCAYVIEGSTLGGLVLASIAARDLGARAPVAYLTLRGSETRTAWQGYLRRLEAFGARSSSRDHDAAARMAVDTFDAYSTSLRRAGLVPAIA